MNTNDIKSFAQQARLLLLEGVSQRLKYWGFDAKGDNKEELQATHGGYIFRGEIYNDATVPAKWKALRERLTSKQAVQDVMEEAAYTWFNRLMAIKILEENHYLDATLQFAEGMRTPLLVQNAKQGNHTITGEAGRTLLMDLLTNNREEQAFALLITSMCNRNQLLHDVFGHINDYTEILIPHNLLQKDGLMDLINNGHIQPEDYQEVELIGWLYQFYISDKKDEVFAGFKKNKKARAQDIPAATQIFTPKWIVKYMVENTVGKIYLDFETDSDLRTDMKYLVANDSDKNSEPIIDNITQLTLLDPACGSGHILVTGFELLFKMYIEVGYNARQAVTNILQHNLFGLDIDDRAMQLARFAVLLKGAQLLGGNGSGVAASREFMTNPTIIPHIYSFTEEQHFVSEELQGFLGDDGQQYGAELREALALLNQGKNIGSALKIELSANAVAHIEKQQNNWQEKQQNSELDIQQTDIWNRLQPMLDVILVLAKKYAAVVANPPYMGQKSMNEELKKYVNFHYPSTKSDLMTVFMEVIPNLTADDSRFALINLPSWLFLSSFEKIREHYIDNLTFDSLLHMGRGIFGIDFGSVAFAIKKTASKDAIGSYFRLHERNFQHLYYEDIGKLFLYSNGNESYRYDFTQYRDEDGITEIPEQGTEKGPKLFYPNILQTNFSKIPGSPIAYFLSEKVIEIFDQQPRLIEFADPKQGLATSDNNRFRRNWSEVSILETTIIASKEKWVPYNSGGGFRKWYGNQLYLVNWENDGFEIINFKDDKGKQRSRPQNVSFYLKRSISWSKISSGGLGVRAFPDGFIFDVAGCSIFEKQKGYNIFLLGLLNSNLKRVLIESIAPTLNYEVGQISNVPVKFENNNRLITLVENCISITKADWDSRETSWDFEQSPLLNESTSQSNAYKRWKNDVTNDFFQLHANEEELNRIFIEIYGLQDELTPEVALKDITILQNELDRKALDEIEPTFREQGKEAIELPIDRAEVISQFISYAIGVFMGRYRLDKPGLNIAHPKPTDEETTNYTYNGHIIEIDEDGILPLMGTDCAFPDDTLVLTRNLVHAIWGEESLTENINFIHNALGMTLHKWLTEKFWPYHTRMYSKKPIYWLFSSNVRQPHNAAFKVLVYMHRMDKYTVQKIQRNYLYPHQEYIKQEIARLADKEANLGRDELKRLELLRKWEIECMDYSEVLKEMANREIEFDLDDGVTANSELFDGAVAKI